MSQAADWGTSEPLTVAGIDAVLAYLPALESEDAEFRLPREIDHEDAPLNLIAWGPDELSPLAADFVEALYDNGFVESFGWESWDGPRRYYEDPSLLDDADLETVRRLLTAHVRDDRLEEGHFADMLERGHVQEILRRLAQLRAQLG
jgi:hypothetical protein